MPCNGHDLHQERSYQHGEIFTAGVWSDYIAEREKERRWKEREEKKPDLPLYVGGCMKSKGDCLGTDACRVTPCLRLRVLH